jgi:hypothetical protein
MAATIFDARYEAELHEYTLRILKRIHAVYQVPYDEMMKTVLQSTAAQAGGCIICSGKKKNGSRCTRKAQMGTLTCKIHASQEGSPKQSTQPTKTKTLIELEYITINDIPYLLEPMSEKVFTYSKSPEFICTLDKMVANETDLSIH